MCDYSLASVPNRLAVVGERLVACRFSTGSMGLTSADAFLRRLWFKETPAVCVPPGARLLLRDIPKDLQRQFDVQATEEVTFVQLSAEAYQYRDAVRFRNGREVLLQWLRCGQCVEVLSLCSEDSREEDTSGARRSIAEFLLSEAELTAVTAACQHLSGAPMLLVERIAHADDAAVCP